MATADAQPPPFFLPCSTLLASRFPSLGRRQGGYGCAQVAIVTIYMTSTATGDPLLRPTFAEGTTGMRTQGLRGKPSPGKAANGYWMPHIVASPPSHQYRHHDYQMRLIREAQYLLGKRS